MRSFHSQKKENMLFVTPRNKSVSIHLFILLEIFINKLYTGKTKNQPPSEMATIKANRKQLFTKQKQVFPFFVTC